MTRPEFLADHDVRQMIDWLRERVDDNGLFVHRYQIRRTNRSWACCGLHDALLQYDWRNNDWTKTKAELAGYRTRLRAAVSAGDVVRLTGACEDVLRWGGVSSRNAAYLERRRDVLLDEISHLAKVLSADEEPSDADICINPRDAATECRMNAGFVKIYSLLLDHFVIYDGRVGAALGLLVRQFCEESGRPSVPEPLKFAYGVPKEAAQLTSRKHRDPSEGAYQFPRLSANSHLHCVHVMRASWLMRETLATAANPFSPGEDGFHELGAALFMVGYDLGGAGSPTA